MAWHKNRGAARTARFVVSNGSSRPPPSPPPFRSPAPTRRGHQRGAAVKPPGPACCPCPSAHARRRPEARTATREVRARGPSGRCFHQSPRHRPARYVEPKLPRHRGRAASAPALGVPGGCAGPRLLRARPSAGGRGCPLRRARASQPARPAEPPRKACQRLRRRRLAAVVCARVVCEKLPSCRVFSWMAQKTHFPEGFSPIFDRFFAADPQISTLPGPFSAATAS